MSSSNTKHKSSCTILIMMLRQITMGYLQHTWLLSIMSNEVLSFNVSIDGAYSLCKFIKGQLLPSTKEQEHLQSHNHFLETDNEVDGYGADHS